MQDKTSINVRWRGLGLPSLVNCDVSTLSSTYGRFIVEPFERGFGTTVGNSIRRVLLSNLEGSAVTQIKIRGAQHEFSKIAGVLEDVTDIVLNVKALVVKNHSDSTRVITIEKNTAGVITGADVQTDSDVEIINKDHVLCTLTDNVPFMMEMVVENGRGYIPSTEHSTGDHEIGIIPVDAIFSPIVRVRYEIEETRVGQKTNFDRMNLEIWTNGAIHPEIALVEAAKILRKHLNPFVQYAELGSGVHATRQGGASRGYNALDTRLGLSLDELELSVRAMNCLESENIHTVRDLVQKTEDQLLEVRNFGETTLHEVKEKLHDLGMYLGMRVPPANAARQIGNNQDIRVPLHSAARETNQETRPSIEWYSSDEFQVRLTQGFWIGKKNAIVARDEISDSRPSHPNSENEP